MTKPRGELNHLGHLVEFSSLLEAFDAQPSPGQMYNHMQACLYVFSVCKFPQNVYLKGKYGNGTVTEQKREKVSRQKRKRSANKFLSAAASGE